MELSKPKAFVIHCGDALEVLKTLPSESVNCCITSPPYFGLRDYGVDGQIGMDETPERYVDRLVVVFREMRRALRDDGTFWLNMGDSYAGSWGNYGGENRGHGKQREIQIGSHAHQKAYDGLERWRPPTSRHLDGVKPKDLIGIPWMVAFALRADGWYLRSEIIWSKPNPMPESVKDRPTKAHEQIFLLTKSARYYYNYGAIKEPFSTDPKANYRQRARITGRGNQPSGGDSVGGPKGNKSGGFPPNGNGRNKRSVWTMATGNFKGAHFAVFPPELPETCMLAGCPDGGVVLDPFSGAATTGIVAVQQGRQYIGIELNPKYVDLANRRFEETIKEGASLDGVFFEEEAVAQECHGTADAQNAEVNAGQFREIMKFLDDSGMPRALRPGKPSPTAPLV
jgi:DNA modification methylase